jgi:hypothetical protein
MPFAAAASPSPPREERAGERRPLPNRRKTHFFDVGGRLSLTPRFSGVVGELRVWGTVSTVSPVSALETVKTV